MSRWRAGLSWRGGRDDRDVGRLFVRMTVARIFRRDLPAALLETVSAIGLAIFAVARMHQGIVFDLKKAAS